MPAPIGIGFIGMGWMGEVHARRFSQLQHQFGTEAPPVRLVVCADDAEARALGGHARFGFEQAKTDWQSFYGEEH